MICIICQVGVREVCIDSTKKSRSVKSLARTWLDREYHTGTALV